MTIILGRDNKKIPEEFHLQESDDKIKVIIWVAFSRIIKTINEDNLNSLCLIKSFRYHFIVIKIIKVGILYKGKVFSNLIDVVSLNSKKKSPTPHFKRENI